MPHSLIGESQPGIAGYMERRRSVIERAGIEQRLTEQGLVPCWHGAAPDSFSGVVIDSREARPGVLFCALRGSALDGHDFVARAAAAGAVAALVERVCDVNLPQLRVSDSRAAASHLASLVWDDPASNVEMVGITGTNGKTTTAHIARHLLAGLGPAGAIGTLGWVDTRGRRHPGRLTTPDPFDLMRTLSHLREQGARYVSMEVSSHALDQRRVSSVGFRVGVFTNLTHEHLDYHPDMTAYRAAKLRLAQHVVHGGMCAVNADDRQWASADFAGRPVVRYGLVPEAEVRAVDVRHGPSGSEWTLVTPEGRWPVRLPLLGEFNVLNALGAVVAVRALGMGADEAADRLATTPPVPGRMEVLFARGPLVLRDYMHTPDAYARVLHTLRGLAAGRLIIVFGCGGDRDRGKRPLMGRIAAEHCDLTIITTDNPRSESPLAIAEEVTADMPAQSYRVILDRAEAIAFAVEQAAPDDVVVLAGKGHEAYQEVAGERIPFDEAGIVATLMEEGG